MSGRTMSGLMSRASTRGIVVFFLLLLLTLTLSLAGCAQAISKPTSTPEASLTPEPATTPSKARTNFQIGRLTINPPEVNSGVEVIITANVTNTSNAEGNYTGELKIDNLTKGAFVGFFYPEKVTIAAGASQLASFVINMLTPATYKVTWGDLIGEFTVVKSTEPTEPPGSTSTVPKTAPKLVPAPSFTGVDVVTNKTISLSQFKGLVILLNFVNYGCSPSVNQVVSAQLLAIRELRKQRSDFVPISVFCGCCPPDVLRKFAKDNDLAWPWILDTDNSIVDKYTSYLRKYGYPTLIFIDKQQYIRDVSGYSDVAALKAEIDKALEY